MLRLPTPDFGGDALASLLGGSGWIAGCGVLSLQKTPASAPGPVYIGAGKTRHAKADGMTGDDRRPLGATLLPWPSVE